MPFTFWGRRSTLTPGTVVNREFSPFQPERRDGFVIADLGHEVIVEWPEGPAHEQPRRLSVVVMTRKSQRNTLTFD